MANDNFFKGFDPANMPSLDLSHTISLASGIQAQIDESNRRTQQIGEEAYKNRQKMQQALEQTAINTAETNTQLQETNTRLEKIIDSQQEYIDLLKNQLTVQQQQLDLDEKQLSILKNIFASGEDGVKPSLMGLCERQRWRSCSSRDNCWYACDICRNQTIFGFKGNNTTITD